MAEQGLMPSTILMSEPDFQLGYLLSLDEAINAFLAFEAGSGRRYEIVYTLDYVDPSPYLLQRMAPKGLPLALDLARGFPASYIPELQEAIKSADAILLPRCPMTTFRLDMEKIAAAELARREITALTPCWDVATRK
jgi:hypothetical protein